MVVKLICSALKKLIDKKPNFKALSDSIADKKSLKDIIIAFLENTPNISSEKILIYVNETLDTIKDIVNTIKVKPLIDIVEDIKIGGYTLKDIFKIELASKLFGWLIKILFKKILIKPEIVALKQAINNKKSLPDVIGAYIVALGNTDYKDIPKIVNKTITYIISYIKKIEDESFIDMIYNIPMGDDTLGNLGIPDFTPDKPEDNFRLYEIVNMILK